MQPRKTPERWYDPCLELDLRLLTMEGFLHHNYQNSTTHWAHLFPLMCYGRVYFS